LRVSLTSIKKLEFKVNDVYSPPSFSVKNGELNNQTKWLWNYFQYYKNCKKISEKIIKTNNSDLIISDEDFASLIVAQNLKIPNILITDVLETKFTKGIASFIEKKMNDCFKKNNHCFENIENIHHCSFIFQFIVKKSSVIIIIFILYGGKTCSINCKTSAWSI
jgi:hypothetical protein